RSDADHEGRRSHADVGGGLPPHRPRDRRLTMRRHLITIVIAGAPGLARAETPAQNAQARDGHDLVIPIAAGVNAPWGWAVGSFGASLSVGFEHHHAVRANFATYKFDDALEIAGEVLAGEEGDTARAGRLYDYGLSYVWYPRRLWDGLTVEAGMLVRDR